MVLLPFDHQGLSFGHQGLALVTKVFPLVTKVFPLVTKVFPLVTMVLPLVTEVFPGDLLITLLNLLKLQEKCDLRKVLRNVTHRLTKNTLFYYI